MRKILLLIVFNSIVFTNVANAQAAVLVFLFGEKVALTNITNWDQSKFRFAMNFGLLATIKLDEDWYLQPEISFISGKGARNVPKVITGNNEVDIILEDVEYGFLDLDYIDAPILLKYYTSQKWHVGLGPYISYLTS
jgi:hypothetical protein